MQNDTMKRANLAAGLIIGITLGYVVSDRMIGSSNEQKSRELERKVYAAASAHDGMSGMSRADTRQLLKDLEVNHRMGLNESVYFESTSEGGLNVYSRADSFSEPVPVGEIASERVDAYLAANTVEESR